MQEDTFYQYLKLLLDYVPIWFVTLAWFVIWLIRNPGHLEKVTKYVSSAKIGDLEVEFREVKEEIKAARQQVEELQNEVLNQNEARLWEIIDSFETHAPVADMADAREALKAVAPNLEDTGFVRQTLKNYNNHKELYAAAEIARTRRDPSLFDDLVACLDKLACSETLNGVRLHTVWTLTSALHRTLISDIKHTQTPTLKREQLVSADGMLDRLIVNDRVQEDRPDNPVKGIRGPAKWSKEWISKGLAKLAAQ